MELLLRKGGMTDWWGIRQTYSGYEGKSGIIGWQGIWHTSKVRGKSNRRGAVIKEKVV